MPQTLRLYHYWQSSCSWRVRWALAVKKVPVEFIHMELLSAQLKQENYLAKNPMGVIPTLEIQNGSSKFLGESVAILDWLEETFPTPHLRPHEPFQRARCLQLTEIINAGTQPLQNIRVARHHANSPAGQLLWNQHWISYGLSAFERLVLETAGKYSIGDTLTWADLAVVPQIYNATVRYQLELTQWPALKRIWENCSTLREFNLTAPERFKVES